MAVPSRVSLLILHTQAESGCLLTGLLPMSTAASIYFSHTHYDIKYVQIQNISTTAAVLTRFAVVRIYSRVQINRKVASPVQNIPGYDVLLLYTCPLHGKPY